MSLSSFHRRTLLSGTALCALGLAAVPLQAQTGTASALIGSRVLSVAVKHSAKTVLAPSVDTVSGLRKRIAALLAPDPHAPKKTKKELQQERQEIAQEMRERFTERHSPKKGEAEPEEEKEGARSAEWEAAHLYQLEQRAFPNDRLDPLAPLRGSLQRDSLQPAVPFVGGRAGVGVSLLNANAAGLPAGINPLSVVSPSAPSTNGTWQYVGPTGGIHDNLYAPNGLYSGRVNALAYDPGNAGTIYLGAAKGGVWKTTNGGTTWVPLTDAQFSLAISSVVVDYSNSNNIYAGTGDYDGGDGVAFGILRSTDAGNTWQVVGTELGTQPIRKILVDPVTPTKIWATAGHNGLFVSYDSGSTWQQVLTSPGSFRNVAFDANHREVYACADGDGVYSSKDGGAWAKVAGAPTPTGSIDIAPSPINSQVLYTVDPNAKSVMRRGFDATGNLTWAALTFPVTPPGARDYWSQSTFYNLYIACSYDVQVPSRGRSSVHDNVFVGLLDVFNSPDDGLAWQYSPDQGHTDQHAIAFNPNNPNDYVIGSDGGCFETIFTPRYYTYVPNPLPSPYDPDALPNPLPTFPTPIIGSYSLRSLNATLGITQFYFAAYNTANANGFIGGAQDNGQPQGSVLSFSQNILGGDGGGCAVNFNAPGTQYCSVYNIKIGGPTSSAIYPIARTDDAWATHVDASLDTGDDIAPFIATIVCDKANPNQVYLGTNYLARYDATTSAWTKLPQRLSSTTYVLSIGTSSTDANTLYAGLQDGNVFYSSNGGTTFRNITSNLPKHSVTQIVVSDSSPTKLFATISGTGSSHVFRCDNANAPNWVDISGSTPDVKLPDIYTNTLAVVPGTNDQQIFVGTDLGVFSTINGGTSWQNATVPLGLPNAQITDLTAVPTTGYLMAATYGRGIWRLPLGTQIPASPTVVLTPTLQGYRGSKAKLAITVTYSSGGQTIQTISGNLTSTGTFSSKVLKAGTYDVYVSIAGFLKKRFKNVQLSTATTTTLPGAFLAGDVNGDNVIDATDLALVRAKLNQYVTNDLTDVDGDGRVTSTDLTIVQGNLNKRGDN